LTDFHIFDITKREVTSNIKVIGAFCTTLLHY